MSLDVDLVQHVYTGRVRVRVCGIYCFDNKILLANHAGINPQGNFWCPPGGGVEADELLHIALTREYKEECNVDISVGKFFNLYEYIEDGLHAIELFFEVNILEGSPMLGIDTESDFQILTELRYFSKEDILQLPPQEIHAAVLDYLK